MLGVDDDEEEPLPLEAGDFFVGDDSLLDEGSLADPDSAFLLPDSPEEELEDSVPESADPLEPLEEERPLEPVRESLR